MTQTESIDPLGDRLARGIETWTAASVMLETCDRLTGGTRAGSAAVPPAAWRPDLPRRRGPRPQPRPRRLPTTGDGDRRLCPEFHDCVKCGARAHIWPSTSWPGVRCPLCRPPGSAAPARETLGLLSALLTGDWVIADASDPRHRREGCRLVAAFLQWHLERGLRSLRMVERRPTCAPVEVCRTCFPHLPEPVLPWSPRRRCATWPSSWMATAGGPTSATAPNEGARGRRGGTAGRRRRSDRGGSDHLSAYAFHRELEALARRRCASSWASTAT